MIRLPEFVREEDVAWALAEAGRNKKSDFSSVTLLPFEEGRCIQCLHIGSYDAEQATLQGRKRFARDNGLVPDLSETRPHHEIYLSDPRKTAPEKLKTILRLPVV